MIFNKHLDRVTELEIVQNFVKTHHMQGKMCMNGDNYSFLLYRRPYVIVFWDALIEDYLEIALVDLSTELLIEGSSALGCSLDLGMQRIESLRSRSFTKHPLNGIFLSSNSEKMRYLHSHLEAIDRLLPLLEAKGGLASMNRGTFDSRFDFSDSVKPIYPGLKQRLSECIEETIER